MATSGALARATDPILPSTNETLWGVGSVVVPLVVAAVVLILVARYFRRLRRSADEAATRARATQREVAALRAELREKSA